MSKHAAGRTGLSIGRGVRGDAGAANTLLHTGRAPGLDLVPLSAATEQGREQVETEVEVSEDPQSDARENFSTTPPTWSTGYASLMARENTDVALIRTGGDGGFTYVEAAGPTYTVMSSMPIEGFLAGLLQNLDAGFASVKGMLEEFSGRKKIDLQGATTFNDLYHAVDVLGGAGGDSMQSGFRNDVLHGGGGNDTLLGGAGYDILWGAVGNDSLSGEDGADQIWGGAGNDTINGGMGADFVMAGGNNDSVSGGEGHDVLIGGSGNDTIDGGDGDDILLGSTGGDRLTGGAGRDLFVFTQGDSGITATNQDQVSDFVRGEDRIDLTGFVESLTLVSAFGGKAFEVRLVEREDGSMIEIDVDGDGVADQQIQVVTSDNAHLDAGDLVI